MMNPPTQTPWHALPSEEVLAQLGATADGLDANEAARRLSTHGPNRLPAAPVAGPLRRFLKQFHNVLIYVLLASAAASLALGHLSDFAVIMAVVIINALIGFIQEGRAENAMKAIAGMLAPRASVRRAGRRMGIAAEQIVPGDVLLLEAGDRVSADVRLIRLRNLIVNEAVLTGESVPGMKDVAAVSEAAVLAERSSMAYSGTLVAGGQGVGVVVATGAATELGHISTLMRGVQPMDTPLLVEMARFGRQITLITLIISALTFAVARWVRDYSLADALMAVIGLAVAAIPEGLPAILTITLAIGVQRMARRRAIIRHLPAVETLGSVSVICSDKTGTLTRNEMMVERVVTPQGGYAVSGEGYQTAGEITFDGVEVEAGARADLVAFARAAVLCNDAALHPGEHGWQVEGDPMEGALLVLAAKAGLDIAMLPKQYPRTDEIPFDATHRFMATLHHSHADGAFIVVKGAPERVVRMCDGAGALDAAAQDLASRGLRVLALATKPAAPGQRDLTFDDMKAGFEFLGLAGFIDPPRAEAIRAVASCREAGIRVVMITGDHALTAREIARQLGISEAPRVVEGDALAQMDDAAMQAAVREVDVFARAAPLHKLRLVEALQANGNIVAMTGDGVNDAPALKRADVGVAMGGKGVEAAREAAQVVLADDNFATIVAAVREGRTVYDNIIKVIAWSIPTNLAEGLVITVAIMLGLALPITPLQILWVNTVTAVALGVTLAFEPGEPAAMQRAPRQAGAPMLSGVMLWRLVFAAVLFLAAVFAMFFWVSGRGMPIETARTLVVNALVVMEVFYLFNVRREGGGGAATAALLVGVAVTALAQAIFTYSPFMQGVFDTRALSGVEWLMVLCAGVAVWGVAEVERRARGRVMRRVYSCR